MAAAGVMVVRYELTINGKNTVGFIQGGYGLGIFNDDELKDVSENLPIPPIKRTGQKIRSYFTSIGLQRFAGTIETGKANLMTARNTLELQLVTKQLFLNEVDPNDIIYQDIYQVVIREWE